MVKAVLRRAGRAATRSGTSPSASTTTSPTSSCRSTTSSRTRARRARCRRCSSASAPTAPSGANKASVKIIGESHRPVRPGLLRVRLEEVRVGDGVAPAVRARAHPVDLPRSTTPTSSPATSSACSSKMTVLDARQARARRSCSTPVPGRRGVGPPAARGAAADHRQATRPLGHRRLPRSPARPAWATASTRSCSRASSSSPACCPPTRRSPRSRTSVETTYAKRGRAIVERNFAAIDASLADLEHVEVPASVDLDALDRSRRRSRTTPPTSCKRVTARLMAGDGDLLPVSRAPRRRHVPDGHGEVREAGDRQGDPDLGSRRSASTAASARSSARTPPSG